MSAKIKMSYEEPRELETVAELLRPVTKSCKADKGGNGRFRRAYMDLEIPEGNAQKGAETPLI